VPKLLVSYISSAASVLAALRLFEIETGMLGITVFRRLM
jgi:hypothetical protein